MLVNERETALTGVGKLHPSVNLDNILFCHCTTELGSQTICELHFLQDTHIFTQPLYEAINQ